ncbi:DNA topoisomerase IV, alpha subunit [Suhomyces tanzawaensis NRRL Y-17324]|uniref:DNA topoisomerase (ATP-hydrolyzing) n=1 Tax=Suhomyces tanzawaensis NRRL Y-17324 TaxID=984487 RepID=A0A1E4SP63_9ASCO|nr:DNA topoisomerase IV, alpha subunit [Suhomyces tanzawaensis NRRL Y-17324]ODV81172.1 DNA topoisomerase IV, alpha subunit [Suhomyces tanzawaensis NRRL Y-17324]
MVKHTLTLRALSNSPNSTFPQIRFVPDKLDPEELLLSIWVKLKERILEDNDMVLALNVPSRKRSFDNLDSTTLIWQFGLTSNDTARFLSIIKCLKLMLIQLTCEKSKHTTVRDVFYQGVDVFQSQRTCKLYLQLIGSSLSLSLQRDLRIFPSQKGLMYGECKELGLSYCNDPILIPFSSDPIELETKQTIIVLEKEAVFKSFCNYLKSMYKLQGYINPNVIVLTGKGFPDTLTRSFLSSIANNASRILGFVDSDVYGLRICNQYAQVCQISLEGAFLLDFSNGWFDVTDREIQILLNFLKELTKIEYISRTENKKWHRELTRGLILLKRAEMNKGSHARAS